MQLSRQCNCSIEFTFIHTHTIRTASYANSTFAAVVVAANLEQLGDDLVALALAKLKPKGRLVVLESAALLDEVKGRLLLGGFVNVQVVNGSGESRHYA